MGKKTKKKKNNVLRYLVLILCFAVLVVAGILAYTFLVQPKEEKVSMYLASDSNEVMVLDSEGTETKLIRGSEVLVSNQTKKIDEVENTKFYQGENTYYALGDVFVENKEDSVLEKELWTYRVASVYTDEESSKLNGVIEKGTKITITGHSEVQEDGTVERYGYEGGFIYAKYLTSDETYAVSANDSSYAQNMASKTEDTYGAGAASDLDYYGIETPTFENNVMPEVCQTLYLQAGVLGNIDAYIDYAKQTHINTFVIDIRDSHVITFQSDVMKEWSPSSYANAIYSKDEMKNMVQKAKDAGIYVVARMTTFKDVYFMEDHPEYAILDKNDNNSPFQYASAYWPSPFVREVWEYNVELSKELITDLNFNEIQYDYVRFPEEIDYYSDILGVLDLQNKYNETRAQAVQRFLMYAADEVHKVGGYISADVFGETSNDYVCAYGQYWPAISSVVDAISAMPYPDHFEDHAYGISDYVWQNPYQLFVYWGSDVANMQAMTPTPAKIRTWIQAYDSIREPFVEYDNSKIEEQIQGLIDAGIYDNGYILWNSGSSLDKYYSYQTALSKY